jgi:hypothetical protein
MHAKLTASLQLLVDLVTLCFGLLALATARRTAHAPPETGAPWYLAGACFTLAGVHGALQSMLALWAVLTRHPAVMEAIRTVQVPGNDGRGFILLAWAALFLGLVAARRLGTPPAPYRVVGILLLAMLAGTTLGVLESPFVRSQHYSIISITSAVVVMMLLAALWLAAVRDSVDYLLWSAVLVYAVREAVDVSLLSIFSSLSVPQSWTPARWHLQALAVVAYTGMSALAARRLVLARRGAEVPALFDLDRSPGSTASLETHVREQGGA